MRRGAKKLARGLYKLYGFVYYRSMDTGASILAAALLVALLVAGVIAIVAGGWDGDLASLG